jgi:polysaccharide biosynthesis protein PslH
MRILFVASRWPYPPLRGDQVRAWHQLRLLASRHRVTVLLDAVDAPLGARAALEALGIELQVVHVGPLSRLAGVTRGVLAGLPLQAALYATSAVGRRLRELLAERRHDILHVQLARLEHHVPPRPPIPVVVDLIDALSLNMARRSRYEVWPLRLLVALEGRLMARLERALCLRRDCATVVSPADREALREIPNLRVNPNGVDLATFKPGAERTPSTIVFTGNQGYFPNVDAALWFAREVLPRVRRARPEATFTIAGDRPARALRRLAASDPAVKVTGWVSEMSSVLAPSAVAVAPLRTGTGQPSKVLEAFACETPVVATPLALSGLELEYERQVLVAESADAFAAQVLRVLDDPALAARLGAAGREVAQRYSWERSVSGLEQIYLELVGPSAPRG